MVKIDAIFDQEETIIYLNAVVKILVFSLWWGIQRDLEYGNIFVLYYYDK